VISGFTILVGTWVHTM